MPDNAADIRNKVVQELGVGLVIAGLSGAHQRTPAILSVRRLSSHHAARWSLLWHQTVRNHDVTNSIGRANNVRRLKS
jgi:hypothetical protein